MTKFQILIKILFKHSQSTITALNQSRSKIITNYPKTSHFHRIIKCQPKKIKSNAIIKSSQISNITFNDYYFLLLKIERKSNT